MLENATPDQRACRQHRYNEVKRTGNGYWFRCVYCGHQIFGSLKGKANEQ